MVSGGLRFGWLRKGFCCRNLYIIDQGVGHLRGDRQTFFGISLLTCPKHPLGSAQNLKYRKRMIDHDTVNEAIARLAAMNNLSLEDASSIFWEIGDLPMTDEEGRTFVTLEDGRSFVIVRP